MKTTVEIDDALFRRAKAIAAREKTTLRSLIEEGLRRVLEDRKKRWASIRDLIYKGRCS